MSRSILPVQSFSIETAVAYVTLSLIALFCAIPFLWVILSSFDGNASLFLALA